MKKHVLNLAIASVLVSGSAFAAAPGANDSSTANIDFTGKVTSSLCQVSTADLNKTIALGEISASALQNGGKAPAQSFSITLNNCATDTGEISYVFSDANGSSAQAAYLEPKASDTAASGVGVFLEQSDGTAIHIGKAENLDIIKNTNGTDALPQQTIPLKAYIGKKNAQSTVTPGTVDASAVLTIRTVAATAPTP
ncbi:fimbrial protein [Escherichia coli]|uniref:fimbrial protein n=1 Tax=Escherichia coli TaxID=562 RepID=UPI000BE4FDB5|nr:fimbrial protein [Escherichia coli]